MSDPTASPANMALPAMYCRRCSYPLIGLADSRCPECGRRFDPADPRTFRRRPKASAIRRASRSAIVLIVIACIVLGPRALRYYHEWQQRRFVEACEQIAEFGGSVNSNEPYEPARAPGDVASVLLHGIVQGQTVDAATVAHLKVFLGRLPPFRLDLDSLTFAPGAFAEFSGVRSVRSLSASGLTNADLPAMIKLPRLEFVALSGRPISDAGIAAMRLPPRVRAVLLARTSVTPAAVARLEAAAPNAAVLLPSVDASQASKSAPFNWDEQIVDDNATPTKVESWVVHFDGNGRPIWRSPRFAGEPTASPVWDAQRVYQPHAGGVTAYDVDSGKPLWDSPGLAGETHRLGDDLLLTFVSRGADAYAQRLHPAQLAARSATTGKLLFDVSLPVAEDWSLTEGVGGPIEAGNLIFCGIASGPKGTHLTLALDPAGHKRFRANGPVVAAITEGDGWILLLPGDVRRVRPDGSTAWLTPSAWGGPQGQLLRLPDGDLIGLTYNGSSETYNVICLNAANGEVRWRYTRPDQVSNHFIYALEVRMELRRQLLAITQDGTDGMRMTVLDPKTGVPAFIFDVPR